MSGKKVIVSGKRFDAILEEYKSKYNVDSLDSPNDTANLHAMIRNQMSIEQLQERLDLLTSAAEIDATNIKKVLDSIVALSEINISLERTLGIDRKTRKQEASESVVDYIAALKQRAKDWLDSDQRLLKVYCKKCQIMVGRISGVYDTTAFEAGFQCPQCKKYTVVKRVERDVFFDVKGADWRRKYPIEIEQPKRSNAPDTSLIEDDLIFNAGLSDITFEEDA
jgi:hypothetical protein